MGAFLIYILKSALCLALFYLFYKWLLSRETFHRFNRWVIGIVLVLSMLLPFLGQVSEFLLSVTSFVSPSVAAGAELPMSNNQFVAQPFAEDDDSFLHFWFRVAFLIYLVGVCFCLARMLYSLVRISYLLRSAKQTSIAGGAVFILHDKETISPFSWFCYVVMSKSAYAENGEVILVHELAHIRLKHGFDLLLAGLVTTLQWFNPAAWLLVRELRNIHEYEADRAVLKNGIDAKQYQLLLIKKAVGSQLYSMACGFTQTQLKKRITMMLKKQSPRWTTLRSLVLLPLAAIAVAVFARPEVASVEARLSTVNLLDPELSAYLDGTPQDTVRISEFNLRGVGVFGSSKEVLIYIDGKKTTKEEMDLLDPKLVKSFAVLQEKEAKEVYGEEGKNGAVIITLDSTKTSKQALQNDGKEVEKSKIPFSISDSIIMKRGDQAALVFIDSKKSTTEELSQLKPEQVESFSILKDKSAKEVYGEEGKNGVVIITTKKENEKK